MFTLKTGTAIHELNPTGETILAVPFDIVSESGEVVQAMRETFPLTATKKDVQKVLARHLAVFTEDHERHEGVKESQAALEASAAVAGEISNITL